jgi:hypothetical protein
MQRSSDVEHIQYLTWCRSRRQGEQSRLQLSRPNVVWSKRWRQRMNVLRHSGAAFPADKVLTDPN